MFELFLNPANMIIGGALISSPIIIHLINRMRFKRLRWAAMEFLLKSQKRNRRRLIIEQMILLLLRILLVLLTGLLLARFLGFALAGLGAHNTVHVVILDDRLSTEDHWKTEDGDFKNSFQLGKQIIEKELAKTIAQARTPQRLVLFRLSEPDTRFDRLVNEDSLRELGVELAKMEGPTARHLDLKEGTAAAADIFGKNPQDERFLHIVSDLRQLHWAEPEASAFLQSLQSLAASGVSVHFIDTAHPYRGDKQKVALYHDNLAVAELRPETRVAAEGMPVQFTVSVANFSASERKNVRVTVKVNGEERPEGSLTMPSVPPGHTSATFQVGFVKLGPNVITAQLENEEAGLQSDNLRYATIEVRRQVPVLVIDGDPSAGDKPGGDTFHVRTLLSSARGYEIIRGTLSDLERPNLDQYPSIYLLNVRKIDSDKALASLESYVKAGGGLAFFLGDRVDPVFYTKKLYTEGKGLFPAPLADQPSKVLTEEEKQEKQLQNLAEPRLQVYVRSDSHPVVAELYKFRNFLTWLTIDRYFPVPRLRWKNEDGHVEELVTLPNDRPVADYQASAQEILDSLPLDDPAYEKFRPALERHRKAIRDTLTGKSLHALATALDAFLHDPADTKEGTVRLAEFWELPDEKIQALRTRVDKFRETVQYGDPLVLTQRFQKGRVVAFLTTAGKKWNDWAGGSPASVTYPMVMIDLQKYLTAADAESSKTVGELVRLDRASARYEPKLRAYFAELREGPAKPAPAPAPDAAKGHEGMKDLGEVLGAVTGESLAFAFDKTGKPGVYQFELTQRGDMGGEPKTEAVAYAFNVDTAHESDLRRASWDELERVGKVHTPEVGSFSGLVDPHRDLSESAWLYLLFLAVLVAEQALAVHLSFHLKASEAGLPARAARAAAA